MKPIPKQVWREGYESGCSGEGVTYTTDPNAGFHWIEVLMCGTAPLASCVRATSVEQAVEFCKARHPNAVLVRCMEEG